MSSALSVLGIDDPSAVEWQDFALCEGDDTNDHYDNYEANENLAKAVDEKCLSCIVMPQCLGRAVENSESGTWGGVFFTAGKPDMSKNKHKSQDVWDEIKERIGGDTLL
jgi:hypothetical protein